MTQNLSAENAGKGGSGRISLKPQPPEKHPYKLENVGMLATFIFYSGKVPGEIVGKLFPRSSQTQTNKLENVGML
jgi:hypothetical protein